MLKLKQYGEYDVVLSLFFLATNLAIIYLVDFYVQKQKQVQILQYIINRLMEQCPLVFVFYTRSECMYNWYKQQQCILLKC